MENAVTRLVCIHCQQALDLSSAGGHWLTCHRCRVENGLLDVEYDLDAVKYSWNCDPLAARPLDLWRYRELLPIDRALIPRDWRVGWTPVISASRLSQELGLRHLFWKDEGRNPTASFKDRASAVGVIHARQLKARTIACASTGNAATSLAGHAALSGISAVIFVPESTPEPKLAQLLTYGAKILMVKGTYNDAYELCSLACERFGWYNRNCAINPVLVEGKKTAGLEIAEQFAADGPPDWIAVGVGDGCTIAGIWKGLVEMHSLGVINRLPRLLGVQAVGASPVEYGFRHNELPHHQGPGTIADSINVQVPRNWRKAVRAVHESGGQVISVTDEEILAAMQIAGRHGMFAEPAAAAGLAGVLRAKGDSIIDNAASVLVMITGSGLKDTKAAMRASGQPIRIAPDIDELSQALGLTADE